MTYMGCTVAKLRALTTLAELAYCKHTWFGMDFKFKLSFVNTHVSNTYSSFQVVIT